MTHQLQVATGFAKGKQATATLAAEAVTLALSKAKLKQASSVFLCLTSEFAYDPQSAIKAASKAASTTQVFGCTAAGIFTDEEWVLDGAAAAAMVFSDDRLSAHTQVVASSPSILTLAAPNAINASWLACEQKRFGGVSGDATGRGPFSVWQNGKGITQGYCELGIQHCAQHIGVSHGVKLMSSPRKVTEQRFHDLISVANIPALTSLKAACATHQVATETMPYHQLMVAFASHLKAFEAGEYQLSPIIISDEGDLSITLANTISLGDWVCWAIRDADTATQEMSHIATQHSLPTAPAFALLFSCLGRGPHFYNGDDQDLNALKRAHPQLPIIGFYGNGEIAPVLGKNTLLQYSTVLGMFSEKV